MAHTVPVTRATRGTPDGHPMGERHMAEDIRWDRRRFLGTTALAMVAAQLGGIGSAAAQLPMEGDLPSLGGATGWLNSPPLTPAGLRGKVVLIDFWTYTCINWLRTLPYVRAWAAKYKDRGLVVIGVHSPEFVFEKNVENVRRAVKDLQVDYPVAIDSDHAIWRAFNNQYWPALYVVDAQGRIRHHHFGEGGYEQSERIMQHLLGEAGIGGIGDELVSVDARGLEVAADWGSLQSPENYVGYERTENFASPGGAALNKRRVYAAPARLTTQSLGALGGLDGRSPGRLCCTRPMGASRTCFHARDLHLVMGPAARGTAVRFRVRIDGKPPGAAHGMDVDDLRQWHSYGTTALSAHPTTAAHRGSTVRDRVSRCGRGGVCVHVRLSHGGGDARIDETIVSWFRLPAAGVIAVSQPMQSAMRIKAWRT